MYLRFVCAWLVITAVAGLDAYLTVKHSSVMNDVEMNAVGLMVLKSEGGVSLLIGLKTAGIALALLFSFSLWQSPTFRRKVLIASYCVATLSLCMLFVMNDDSFRSDFVEKNDKILNATRMAPEQFLKHQKMLRDSRPTEPLDHPLGIRRLSANEAEGKDVGKSPFAARFTQNY